MSAEQSAPEKLPAEEWRFEEVSENELEACFWWEYAREAIGADLRLELLKSDCDSAFEVAMRIAGRRFVRADLLAHFLRSPIRESFAARSAWQKVPSHVRNAVVKRLARGRPAIVGTMKTYRERLRNLPALIDGAPHPFGDEATFFVRADWRFTDKEICERILREMKKLRPANRPNGTRPRGRSLFGFKPKMMTAALGWLGIIRIRRDGRCPWSDFNAAYKIGSTEPDLMKARRNAEELIAWMQDGSQQHLDRLPAGKTRARLTKSELAPAHPALDTNAELAALAEKLNRERPDLPPVPTLRFELEPETRDPK